VTRRGSVAGLVLIALLCGAAPARAQVAPRCADGGALLPGDDGIGGTGAWPGDDGIGGTGAWPGGDDSGIGGTGVSAHSTIGVVGTITGFASICVGGIEVHYDADTPVRIDGRPASVADLAVGQVVEVIAEGNLPELRARDLTVRHVVVGPVSGVEADGAILRVAGQSVALVPETQLPDAVSGADTLALGTVVQVSGMRRQDGVVVASRITRGQADDGVQITGPVETSDAGGLSIAGTPLEIAGDVRLAVGENARVAGRWTGTALRVDGAEAVPHVPFDGRVARIDVEGFPRWSANGELRVDGVAIARDVAPPAFGQLGATDARVRIGAWLEGGGVVVDRVQPAPALPVRPPRIEGHGAGALIRKLGRVFVFRSRAAGRSASGRITVHSGGVRPAPPPGAIPDLPIRPTAPDSAERVEQIERPPVPGVGRPLRPPQRPPRLQRPPRPPMRPGR
jgi:hypothetical protein